MLGPKTASESKQSWNPLSPVSYFIYARSIVIIHILPAIRQIELTIINAMLKYLKNTYGSDLFRFVSTAASSLHCLMANSRLPVWRLKTSPNSTSPLTLTVPYRPPSAEYTEARDSERDWKNKRKKLQQWNYKIFITSSTSFLRG